MLKKIISLTITGIMALSMVGCSSSGDKIEDAEKTLYFIPIVDTGAYWSPMRKGAEETAKKLGYKLITKTSPPSEAQKNEKHIGFIQEAIANKVAGIAIAPMDPDMFDNKVAEAKNAGIPVVTFDADVNSSDNRVAYVGTDNKLAGEELGKNAGEKLKAEGITGGKFSLVAVNMTQTTMTYRRDGLIEGLKESLGSDYDNFTWLESIQDDDQAAVSKQQLEGQITANPDIVAVFSLGSEGPDTGTMEAIKSQNKAGEILHFGFDYTPIWENGIDNGLITAIVDQDSYNIGVQVITTLVQAIEGKKVDSIVPIPVKWVEAKDIVVYGKEKEKQYSENVTE